MPPGPVPAPVEEHMMLLQASNDNQLDFQKALQRTKAKGMGLLLVQEV